MSPRLDDPIGKLRWDIAGVGIFDHENLKIGQPNQRGEVGNARRESDIEDPQVGRCAQWLKRQR